VCESYDIRLHGLTETCLNQIYSHQAPLSSSGKGENELRFGVVTVVKMSMGCNAVWS
jgi:hypothetical protein